LSSRPGSLGVDKFDHAIGDRVRELRNQSNSIQMKEHVQAAAEYNQTGSKDHSSSAS
jgi:hypothetical protein